MIWSIFFHMHSPIWRSRAEVDRPQILERMVVGLNALCSGLFVASLFVVTRQSHQAHEHNICLSWAVAILRRTSYCAETGHFLPLFWVEQNTPSSVDPGRCQWWYSQLNNYCIKRAEATLSQTKNSSASVMEKTSFSWHTRQHIGKKEMGIEHWVYGEHELDVLQQCVSNGDDERVC